MRRAHRAIIGVKFQGIDIAFSRIEKIGVDVNGNEISLLTNYRCI